jgi:hypothetical protein
MLIVCSVLADAPGGSPHLVGREIGEHGHGHLMHCAFPGLTFRRRLDSRLRGAAGPSGTAWRAAASGE